MINKLIKRVSFYYSTIWGYFLYIVPLPSEVLVQSFLTRGDCLWWTEQLFIYKINEYVMVMSLSVPF